MNKVTVFLPMRKGSQRIKNKNIRDFSGIKGGLSFIKISQLLKVESISKIVISTDDDEIKILAKSFNNDKIIIKTTVICLNKKENLKFIIENWVKFIIFKKLCLIFVNPKKNTKWLIIPYNHNKISEDIKPGLKTLFKNLEET